MEKVFVCGSVASIELHICVFFLLEGFLGVLVQSTCLQLWYALGLQFRLHIEVGGIRLGAHGLYRVSFAGSSHRHNL